MKFWNGFVLMVVLFSGSAWGKHWHDDWDHWKRHQEHHDRDRDYDRRGKACYFDAHDIRILSDYYAPRYQGLPPGLGQRYWRDGYLTAGWESRMEPIPSAVQRDLAPIPFGYRRGLIDGFVVVYRPITGFILDASALFIPCRSVSEIGIARPRRGEMALPR